MRREVREVMGVRRVMGVRGVRSEGWSDGSEEWEEWGVGGVRGVREISSHVALSSVADLCCRPCDGSSPSSRHHDSQLSHEPPCKVSSSPLLGSRMTFSAVCYFLTLQGRP